MAEKITVRQASREADVTAQRIITLIKEGVIKAEKFGFQYAVERASFDAWLVATGRKKAEQSDQGEQGAEASTHA